MVLATSPLENRAAQGDQMGGNIRVDGDGLLHHPRGSLLDQPPDKVTPSLSSFPQPTHCEPVQEPQGPRSEEAAKEKSSRTFSLISAGP